MDPLKLIRRGYGSLTHLANELGITRGAVAKWDRIPAERVLEVERVTGISRHQLRPDLYPATDHPSTPQPRVTTPVST